MQHEVKGRVWREVGRLPYTRKDGSLTELIQWETRCVKCEAMAVITTPAINWEKTNAFGAKHCEAHKLTFAQVRALRKAQITANSQPGADLV